MVLRGPQPDKQRWRARLGILRVKLVGLTIFTRRKTSNSTDLCTISDFCRDVDKICALLGHYAACSGNSVSTFRDSLSVPSPKVEKLEICWPLTVRPLRCSETSADNCHSALRNTPEERGSHLVIYILAVIYFSSTLEMETTGFPDILLPIYQAVRCRNYIHFYLTVCFFFKEMKFESRAKSQLRYFSLMSVGSYVYAQPVIA